ncbi:MAG: AAA family ATPase [Clostridium sp.]|uniref:AAA family ATPase n=1 Tax=Clostridium sp. TaxID=1506 RepID=UPI0025C6D83F|nr:AAA family ATPase [Clostridium sp.]MCE5220011.1 AAA family ATPase [Clostridium sp.]
MDKIIKEFTCTPFICSYDTDKFKIYAVDVNEEKFPDIKKNKYDNYTIMGNTHNLALGNIPYHVKAEEQKSQNGYGYQYKIIHIQRDRPTNEITTQMFLSEILTPDQVKTIMENYPDIIDRVINNRLDDIDLNKLYNIGQYRLNVIKRKIEENFVFAELIEMFQGLIDMNTIRKLYDKYPSTLKIKQEIQNEPYKCLCSLSKIGFKTADSIIIELDKESKKQKEKGKNPSVYFDFDIKTSVQRAIASVEYLLEQNENDGHTRILITELRKLFDKLTPECKDKFVNAIKNSEDFYVDKDSKTVSFLETYNTELYIAEKLIEGLKVENKWEEIDIEEFRKIDDNELTDEQFEAVKMFYNNNISMLIGGGGVGKSYTTKVKILIMKTLKKLFDLFAPTGRASKVLSGYTKENASTIHRGLYYNPSAEVQWGYNENNKIPYDVVIVDEMSMTDIFLMKRLIEAIDFTRTKLLFIGDDFQIPSVGAGNVLYDLINSEVIPTTILTKVFRFGIGGISTISTKTRFGEQWIEDRNNINIFGEDKGYIYMPMQQKQIMPTIKSLYTKLMNNGVSPEDILILSSYNIGDYGTEKINEMIQQIANKNYDSDLKFKCGNTTYYLDDIVIQTKNNYKAIIYNPEDFNPFDDEMAMQTFISNGDIGKVILIDSEYMVVQFDNEKIIYDRDMGLNLKLAYSISMHKSQGGSCKNIIMITPKAHTFMLNANLIYVGQTRAEQRCYHLGDPDTINRALKKKANLNRKTHLKDMLIKLHNN